MKILIDECIDWRLIHELPGFDAKTVKQMGWVETKNGALLDLAECEFDVFVTVDRNLSYQQSLAGRQIALVVLRARTNRLRDLLPLIPELRRVLPHVRAGETRVVE